MVLDVSLVLDGARLVVLGGTGFLGKLLLTMLLDRYPEVGRLFVVVRAKGGLGPEERFWRDVATHEVLGPLRRTHGERFEAFLREKVQPIDGDMGRPRCGIDESVVRELRGTIDAVVNLAGVIDFNPSLDDALDANAFGAQNLVDLARALEDVPVLHTSTCYVAGRRKGPIREEDPRVHPFPRADELGAQLWDPQREIAECLDLVKQANHRCDDAFRQSEFQQRANENLLRRGEPAHGPAYDRELARVKRRFVIERLVEAGIDRATHWGWPNIYTYTKALGEQVIAESGLEFAIARPAICESTIAFPFPSYNEGVNASAPILYFIMKGQPHILAQHVPLDLIPADQVVAGMILALVELLEGTAKPVYHFGASDSNPCTAQRFGELVGLYKRKHYQRKGGNYLLNALQARFEPTFVDRAGFDRVGAPAIASAARGVAKLVKQKMPALAPAAAALEGVARNQARVAEILTLFEPFDTRVNGPFDCSNVRGASARLSDEDRAKLPWAPEAIDWADWMMNVHMPAIEKRIMPEIDERLRRKPAALAAHRTLVTLVDEMAERHDLALALQLRTDEGLTRTTFRDVRAGSMAVAARLAALGVAKGDRVALSARNHPDWPVAFFGIVRAGATAVPIDPGLDAASWSNVLAESGARVVVWNGTVEAAAEVAVAHPALAQLDLHDATATGGSADVLPARRPTGGSADVLPARRPTRGSADVLPARRPPDGAAFEGAVPVDPDDVASLLFTSGTTGRPKGVMLTHANFTSLIAALGPVFPLGARDVVLSVLPLHHTFEFTCGMLLPFSRGARVVYLHELTGDELSRGLQASRATAMIGVPALWQLLERRILQEVSAHGPVARAAFDAAGEANRWLATNVGLDVGRVLFGPVHAKLGGRVKWLISGGAALPRETQERFAGLGLALTSGYGLTEAAPVLTVSRPGKRLEPGVGKPVPGVEVKIASPDDRGIGEVVARGPNVMVGYTDAEATRRTIDAEGWLHTGDLGRFDAKGRLEIVGRRKDVVVSATGENVYPDDVETRLGEVPHVAELAVVGVETRAGEQLACLAVPAPSDRALARVALRDAIAALPFGQRPSIVHLYEAALPRTATQKVKRDEVRAIIERLMAASVRDADGVGSTPSSGVRQAIAAVRGSALEEVSASAVLVGELGLDSLAMTELLEALEGRFGSIDPQRLQACATVADVEALVVGDAAPQPPARQDEEDVPDLVLPEPVQALGKAVLGRLQHVFYGEVMKPRVFGRAHIPHNRNVIVVANHASHLDMGFVRFALGRYGESIVSLAAQDYFFEGRSSSLGGIKRAFFENFTNLQAFDRRASVRQALRQASEVIERGKTVLVFPEGTRSESGAIQPFKPMVGHLALVHGVDILPVFLGGTHASLPKGAAVPRKREIVARIGPPLCIADLRRVTEGMAPADAAREVARIAREAVVALSEGQVLDVSKASRGADLSPEREHPLVKLFGELESRFRAGELEKQVSYYVSLGNDELAKWTVRVDGTGCEVRPGKPEGGQADCVLKTSPEIFAKIVRESYVPSPADFVSGAVKSNDVGLLMTFQKVFQLDHAS
jgi:long-chain acyl-CoA synthetase